MLDQGDNIADALDQLHDAGWWIGDTAFYDVERGDSVLSRRPKVR